MVGRRALGVIWMDEIGSRRWLMGDVRLLPCDVRRSTFTFDFRPSLSTFTFDLLGHSESGSGRGASLVGSGWRAQAALDTTIDDTDQG